MCISRSELSDATVKDLRGPVDLAELLHSTQGPLRAEACLRRGVPAAHRRAERAVDWLWHLRAICVRRCTSLANGAHMP